MDGLGARGLAGGADGQTAKTAASASTGSFASIGQAHGGNTTTYTPSHTIKDALSLSSTLMGQKRSYTEAMDDSTKQPSPFLPMFEVFRAELDEHHDRRERVIKASRDITAASKKM